MVARLLSVFAPPYVDPVENDWKTAVVSQDVVTSALEAAAKECRANLDIGHIIALRRLNEMKLVRQVKTWNSAFYRITRAGRSELRRRHKLSFGRPPSKQEQTPRPSSKD